MNKPKVIVVMPAYNAEKTVEKTFKDIPQGCADEVILVDDASKDNTVSIAERLGIKTVRHEVNKGYGANQKTCYELALKDGADIVVMVHPDYQYDSRLTPYMVGLIKDGVCDVIFGTRVRTRKETLEGGMPVYKYISNRALTFIENIVLGQNLSECHTGFRAYSRRVLETIPYGNNSDNFVFDTQFLVQAVAFGFRIGEIPVPTRYFKEASQINIRNSIIYGLATLWTIFRFFLFRLGIKKQKMFKRKT